MKGGSDKEKYFLMGLNNVYSCNNLRSSHHPFIHGWHQVMFSVMSVCVSACLYVHLFRL